MTVRTVISYKPTCFRGELNANYANKFTRESVEVKKMEKTRCANPHDLGASFQGSNPCWWFLNKTVMCLANLHSRLNITHIPPVPPKFVNSSDMSAEASQSQNAMVENESSEIWWDWTGWWFFTNPFEKYARQIGSFPQGSGWKFQKYLKPTT